MEQRKYAYALKQSILRLQLKIKTKISYQPEKKKEAQQAQEIEELKTQLAAMNGKFSQLVDVLSVKLGDMHKTEI